MAAGTSQDERRERDGVQLAVRSGSDGRVWSVDSNLASVVMVEVVVVVVVLVTTVLSLDCLFARWPVCLLSVFVCLSGDCVFVGRL